VKGKRRFHLFQFSEYKLARRRVVITGLGIVSPVGNSVEDAWQNVLAGRSGIDRITRFDVSSFPVQIAGEVRGFDLGQYLSPKEARRMDVFIHYGMAAGIQAIRDAGLDASGMNPERIGVSIGSGIGGLPMIESTCDDFAAGGVRKVSPFFRPRFDHQHDLRQPVDHVRLQGSEHIAGQRLFDRNAQHR